MKEKMIELVLKRLGNKALEWQSHLESGRSIEFVSENMDYYLEIVKDSLIEVISP